MPTLVERLDDEIGLRREDALALGDARARATVKQPAALPGEDVLRAVADHPRVARRRRRARATREDAVRSGLERAVAAAADRAERARDAERARGRGA